jgi:hypothetical protein
MTEARTHNASLKELGFGVIPLLRRHDVYLHVYPTVVSVLNDWYVHSKNPKDRRRKPGARFAERFLAVWRRLPLAVKRTLLKHRRDWPSRLNIELNDVGLREDGLSAACAGWRIHAPISMVPRYDARPRYEEHHSPRARSHILAKCSVCSARNR